ncbi:MAG TPA: cytochrome c oxidase accessory protein CcoG [Alphaproteobacteria bacterium]|nr:cytochrome c oxidase accessory protein CcoG [Alphaproteobacteria bacterium]
MPQDAQTADRVVVTTEDAQSVRAQKAVAPIYANRIKVYPKSVDGTFRRLKWAVLAFCLAVYYLVPWLRWDRGPSAPSQAILIDLPGRRAYFFFVEIWPQEVYFLAGLMIFGAIALFLVSSLFGRLWCGYACPQTVWTDLFMFVERWIEGDRNARVKLDRQPWTAGKLARKTLKHTVWLAIAAATGGAWVFYYADAPTTLRAIFTGGASTDVYFFVGLFTATTYLLAGWAREQVCTYMCPWPRFQAAMFDENTLTVTYHSWRGEPRGSHKAGESWDGRGDCVDCRQCIAVCPTGIDIRDGQQLECIGCGLCIDACATVMDKVGRPRGLISFDTIAGTAAKAERRDVAYRLMRPRVILYVGLLAVVGVVMVAAFALRSTLDLTILHDRAPLFVMLSDGSIRNGYTIKIVNKTRRTRHDVLTAEGLPGATLRVVEANGSADAAAREVLEARPDTVATYRLYVTAPRRRLPESTPLTFRLRDQETGATAQHGTVFLAPGRGRGEHDEEHDDD